MAAIVEEVICEIGDTVYIKHDPDRLPRVCIKFIVSKYHIIYELALGNETSQHYDFEIVHNAKDCIVI